MLTSHVRVALRRLRKDLGYTSVNLIGLTIGFTVSLLIATYVFHELSYDEFHAQADRLYRITLTESFQDQSVPVLPPAPLGPSLTRRSTQVESAVRIRFSDHPVYVSTQQREPVREPRMSFADANLFEVFGFSLRRGNPATALTRPYSIVLSRSAARTYFGAQDPVGKTLTMNGEASYTVTGVLARPPGPSHLSFDLLASHSTLPERGISTESWSLGHSALYLLAAPSCGESCLTKRVSSMIEGKTNARSTTVTAEPIPSVHLYGQSTGRQPIAGDVRYLWLLGTTAVLVLLMACVNYTNLATARSLRRVTEIGVHKTLGASRSRLVLRYLAESIFLCVAALLIATVLAVPLLPAFGGVLGVEIHVASSLWTLIGSFALVALATGLVAGAYPAFYLSRFQPANVLRGSPSTGQRGLLRTVLVVFQFTVSIALLAGSFVIHDQLEYFQQRDLGFNAQNLVVVNAPPALRDDYTTLKDQFLQIPGVEHVTRAPMPGHKNVPNVSVQPEGHPEDEFVWVPTFGVDDDFLATTGVSLVAGRGFRPEDGTGAGGAVLVNETAREKFGWDDAVGRRIDIPVDGNIIEKRVVGVVKDFHYGSLEQSIQPVVIHLRPHLGDFTNVLVRLSPSSVGLTVNRMNEEWSRRVPAEPFIYQFMDREFASYYRTERRIGHVVGLAAGLAILIAALGLFGLAAYVVERRTKEIGIRKALGASATNIFTLLVRNVLALVGISVLVAAPIAYVSLQQWLNRFAYRVSVGVLDLAIVTIIATLLAVVAVSYQVLSAANVNPVGHLRSE